MKFSFAASLFAGAVVAAEVEQFHQGFDSDYDADNIDYQNCPVEEMKKFESLDTPQYQALSAYCK